MNLSFTRRKGEYSHTFHRGLVFLSAYAVMCLNMAVVLNLGVLFSDIRDTFRVDRAKTAVVQSATIATLQLSGICTGALINKFGPRRMSMCGAVLCSFGISISFVAKSIIVLYFGICICTGIGVSILAIGSSTIVGHHFNGRNLVLMLSLYSTSTGVGGLGLPYLLVYLNNMYGLRGTLLIIGGVLLNSFAAVLSWTAPVKSANAKIIGLLAPLETKLEDKSKDMVDNSKSVSINTKYINKHGSYNDTLSGQLDKCGAENEASDENPLQIVNPDNECSNKNISIIFATKILVKNKCYVLFCISTTMSFQALSMFAFFANELLIDKGFKKSETSVALMAFNLAGIVGRILPGLLTKLPRVTTLSIPMLAVVLGIVATIILILVKSFWLTIIVYCISGVGFGIVVTTFSATTVKLVGPQLLPNAMGILFTITGFVTPVIGPISGYVRGQIGSYTIPLIANASSMTVALILLMYAQWTRMHLTAGSRGKT